MTDYAKIGLKVGLEIHQQLDTKKLFCNCPSHIRDDPTDVAVERTMKAVVGETGSKDVAASYEEGREKKFQYVGYSDSTCLVEMDEAPPQVLNHESLGVVLQVAKHLGCRIVDEVQVMRKTVVDGSNTSGFQRTALVAMDGRLEDVGIATVAVEEDSAKIVSRSGDKDVYNVSRLGIPLIEIGTAPDIKTPFQAQHIAATLGMILRSTGRVKRGLGTIRQDVNVSIAGGQRIEIKGAQDLKLIPTFIENEIVRQQKIISLKEKFAGAECSSLHDVSAAFPSTQSSMVQKALERKEGVFGFSVSGMHGIVGTELQPGKRVGSDLSDYAKAKAGIGGLIHSDEKLEKYKFIDDEINAVKEELGVGKDDAFILIVADRYKADIAHKAVIERLGLLSNGVPKDVRKANDDGTTSFLRPLPGAARMYPETDVIPAMADVKRIPKIILLTERVGELKEKYGLGEDLAKEIVNTDLHLFLHCVSHYENIKPAFIAEVIVGGEKAIKAQFSVDAVLHKKDYEETFAALDAEKIPKAAVYEVLKAGGARSSVIGSYKQVDDSHIEEVIRNVLANRPDATAGALMGLCMKALGGKVDGKKVNEILAKVMKK